MANRRDIRKLALGLLYQLDVRGGDEQDVKASLDDNAGNIFGEDNEEARIVEMSEELREQAWLLALGAWQNREAADKLFAQFAPEWPTHRQPPVDRAMLRLSAHEMMTQWAPDKVTINEAIELAKEFGGENSPTFINGVLDRLSRHLQEQPDQRHSDTPAPKAGADEWLTDAIKESDTTQPPAADESPRGPEDAE